MRFLANLLWLAWLLRAWAGERLFGPRYDFRCGHRSGYTIASPPRCVECGAAFDTDSMEQP